MKSKIIIFLMVLGFVSLSFLIVRSQFELLTLVFTFLFGGYLLLLLKSGGFSFKKILLIGLIFRLCFLISSPVLSDDYFRFIWDGRILASGNNPYLFLPNAPADSQRKVLKETEVDNTVYRGLNSKQYYSVYPPINQLLFALPTSIANKNITVEYILLRLMIIGFEIASFFLIFKLLKHYNQKPTKLAIYAFNPLVIVELSGNLHFEGVVLFFGLLAVWLWITDQKLLSPIAFSMAVGVKLIPLMLLPILLRKMKFWQAFLYGATVVVLFMLYFLPFLNSQLIANFSSSIDLYFRNFEFNASIFYLVRAVGFRFVGYDIIHQAGPLLSVLVLGLILLVSFHKKLIYQHVFEKSLLIITIYFAFATTVHPWYITTLVGLSVFTTIRYPIFWSYLVVLSYSHYWGNGFHENYLLVFVEYFLLSIVIIYEFLSSKKILWQV